MTKLNKHLAQMILASDDTCCTQAHNDFMSHCQTLDSLQNDHSAVFTTTYVCQCAPMYAHCQAWPNTYTMPSHIRTPFSKKPCQCVGACVGIYVRVYACVFVCHMHAYTIMVVAVQALLSAYKHA